VTAGRDLPTDRFAAARAVASAVLYEGYVLYPYRASARKNQLRWQFGVLAPPAFAAADGSERSALHTEVMVDPGGDARLSVRIRFLTAQHRAVEAARSGSEGFEPVASVDVDGTRWVPWDEAVEHEVDLDVTHVLPVTDAPLVHGFTIERGQSVELLTTSAGEVAGRVLRQSHAVEGRVLLTTAWADGTSALVKVAVDVENVTAWSEAGATRDAAMARSLLAVHTMLAVDDGEFVSLLDPPPWAVAAAAGCRNDGSFPVLIGVDGDASLALSSPIILYDYPTVAPESPGDFCDATEIDEILALRVLTLTDDEKAEARGTDPRAAAIVDRCDDMSPEVWEGLHGSVRAIGTIGVNTRAEVSEPAPVPWWDPGIDGEVDPWSDTTWVGDVQVGKGAFVRLRPSRRADAHDLFLAGRTATVAGVFRDVDGGEHVAVSLDDDPASEMFEWQGRYLFFAPDEIEVLP
jgi:hypothetical protein